MDKQNRKIGEYLTTKIEEVADLFNKLEVYPTAPSEMAEIMHSFGLN